MPRANSCPRLLFGTAALLLLTAAPAAAQRRDLDSWLRDCSRNRSWEDRERICMVTEVSIADPGSALVVDGQTNGGIRVTGSSRRDVLVRARIETYARTEARAEEIAKEVRIRTERGRVFAEGPEVERREGWSVSFDIEVPSRIDLDLKASNGGLAVEDVTGVLRLETTNGGIRLDAVGGDVIAETSNGGVSVRLEGARWEGKGLDAITTNGGVTLRIPENYSARLETGTTNGGVDIDFPVTVQGRIGRRITAELGRGGPTVRVMTTNGGVFIRRSE
jgi:DUF4097 and DUF4098 domain-containing protein YvlB